MKKIRKSIATFCLFLFSNQILASERLPAGIGSGFTPPHSATGHCDPRNPATLRYCNPNSGFPGGFTPPKPSTQPPRLTFDHDIKLPGTFGSPAAELLKGRIANAKASCLQDAIAGGEPIPTDEASIWNFANLGLKAPAIVLPKAAGSSIALSTTQNKPEAFKGSGSCHESLEHEACIDLFGKSIKDVPQAYYKSGIKDNPHLWDEVAIFLGFGNSLTDGETKDINQILLEAQENADSSMGTVSKDAKNLLESLTSEDPLITATNLIIQKIDQSLAMGDMDGAMKGQELLQKLNPSAAHSLECLGVYHEKLLDDVFKETLGGQRGSGIGPISGVDYHKLKEQSQYQNAVVAAAVATAVLMAVQVIKSFYDTWGDKERKEEKHELDKQAALDGRIKDYMACSGDLCAALYPDAAKAVADAEAKTKAATTLDPAKVPSREAGESEGSIRMPEMIITAPMPSKGTGGSGGDVAAPEIALESGPLNRATTGDDNKRVDPEATQHFCSQVIRGYKDFRNQEIKNQGRPLGEIRPTLSIVPSGAGIAHFDQWDSKFWAEKNEELKASNRNNDRENNCRVMDEVQGL